MDLKSTKDLYFALLIIIFSVVILPFFIGFILLDITALEWVDLFGLFYILVALIMACNMPLILNYLFKNKGD